MYVCAVNPKAPLYVPTCTGSCLTRFGFIGPVELSTSAFLFANLGHVPSESWRDRFLAEALKFRVRRGGVCRRGGAYTPQTRGCVRGFRIMQHSHAGLAIGCFRTALTGGQHNLDAAVCVLRAGAGLLHWLRPDAGGVVDGAAVNEAQQAVAGGVCGAGATRPGRLLAPCTQPQQSPSSKPDEARQQTTARLTSLLGVASTKLRVTLICALCPVCGGYCAAARAGQQPAGLPAGLHLCSPAEGWSQHELCCH